MNVRKVQDLNRAEILLRKGRGSRTGKRNDRLPESVNADATVAGGVVSRKSRSTPSVQQWEDYGMNGQKQSHRPRMLSQEARVQGAVRVRQCCRGVDVTKEKVGDTML